LAVPSTVEPIDPKVTYPAGTVFVDNDVIVHRVFEPVGRQVEVHQPFTRAVAAGPTGTYGLPNGAVTKSAPKAVKK